MTPACTATRWASCPLPACRSGSWKRSTARSRSCCAATRAPMGPSRPRRSSERYGLSEQDAVEALTALERAEELVRGEIRPQAPGAGREREWCDPEVLRRLRRASIAALRREIEPTDQARWRASPSPGTGSTGTRGPARRPRASACRSTPRPTGCARCSRRCRALRSRPRPGSATCCRAGSAATTARGSTACAPPARWSGRAPAAAPAAAGAWRCTSARTLRSSAPRRSCRSTARAARVHDALRERLAAGAAFWSDLLVDLDHSPVSLRDTFWDLVWSGEVTNDAFAPLRARRLSLAPPAQHAGRRRRFGSRRRAPSPSFRAAGL